MSPLTAVGQQENNRHIIAIGGEFMTKNYSAKDVRVLEEVQHIRLNPSMYIGDTSTPTHLIEEALDNALDEALAGYAKIIAVIIDTADNRFSVLDDGRGIPISDNTPVTISSKLFSGAKFQDKKSAYEISSGLHGVGLVAINALSSEYNVEVFRNKKYARYHFKNAKLKKSDVNKSTLKEVPFSTKIEFIPDKQFFETLEPDLDRIRNRLTTASAELPTDIQFVLVIDEKKEIFKLSEKERFVMNCLTGNDEVTLRTIIAEKKPEVFKVLFAYEKVGSVTPKIISSVNLLPVASGGTHLNAFYDLLKEFFTTRGKKLGYKFQPNDSLVGLRAYLMLSLIEPKFSGQTKDKLTNRKTDFEKFTKVFRGQLDVFADRHPDEIKVYLERFQDYRRKLDSKKLTRNGSDSNRASTKFTKLRDCSSREGELFVVEGDSAGGTIIQARDPRIHAVLPLRGKSIPNVTMKKNILENKEVGELVRALGTGVGPHFNLSKLRYSKIICAADADPDGGHIACLFSMVMAILLPEVVKAGKYYIAQTPLFAITEKKTFVPLWTDEELEKARKNGKTIQRYKGLGEMNPKELKISLLDTPTRNLTQLTYTDDIEYLIKLFSDPGEKRRLVS
jgi:DNA gyrase subunit B